MLHKATFSIFLLVNCALAIKHRNNVCSKFSDYFIKDLSKNCWFNPDFDKDIPELITQHNYPLKTYQVTTEDGYILNVFRLPRHTNAKGVVYLQHPATASSSCWVDKGNRSLAYLLYDEGYDVWLGNYRGSFYSREHVSLNADTSNAYWNFSYHEHAIYDMPTTLNLIFKETHRRVAYVSHSMSAQAAVIYAALQSQHAMEHVNAFIMYAPPIYMQHTSTAFVLLAPYADQIYKFLELFHLLEVEPRNQQTRTLLKLCNSNPIGIELCAKIEKYLFGDDQANIDPALQPILFSQNPAGISAKVVYHYAQLYNSGRFAQFDYGTKLNQLYYHSDLPPEYPLAQLNATFYVYGGGNDNCVNITDIQTFVDNVKRLSKSHIEFTVIDQFNHVDFAYVGNIVEMLYKPTINLINQINDGVH